MSEQKWRVAITAHVTVSVPEDWEADNVDFWLNESSHCLGTEFQRLGEHIASMPSGCDICSRANAVVVGKVVGEDKDGVCMLESGRDKGPRP